MGKSIATTWPSAIHLLCTFHIWKNFFEHIQGLFKGQNDKWKLVQSMFWKLAKSSDIYDRSTFDATFDKLIAYVDTNGGGDPAKKVLAIEWLHILKNKKQQWAACYTWGHSTLGIHSTVRSEAINSVIASFCKVKNNMCTLVRQLETMVEHQLLQTEFECLRREFSSHISDIGGRHPIAEKLCERITPNAAHLIRAQASQSMLYCKRENTVPIESKELQVFKDSLGEDCLCIGRTLLLSSTEQINWKKSLASEYINDLSFIRCLGTIFYTYLSLLYYL